MSRLTDELELYFKCNQGVVRVDTDEPAEVIRELTTWKETKRKERKIKIDVSVWTPFNGLCTSTQWLVGQPTDPLSFGATLDGFIKTPTRNLDHEIGPDRIDDAPPSHVILLVTHLPTAIAKAPGEVMSGIDLFNQRSKYGQRTLILLNTPGDKLPTEITNLCAIVKHAMPTAAEYAAIAEALFPENKDDKTAIAEASRGLTRGQAERIYASTLGRLFPHVVWNAKADLFNADGLLQIETPRFNYKDVVGLQGAKNLIGKLVNNRKRLEAAGRRIRGFCMAGPGGTGKSMLAEATALEFSLPYLQLNPSALLDKWLGNSEQRLRKALDIAKQMAPCVVLVDEVDRVLHTGEGAHETSQNFTGTLLTEMQTMKESVIFFFTSNHPDRIDPVLIRDGRLDARLYVGFPGLEARLAAWDLYLKKFEMPVDKAEDSDLYSLLNGYTDRGVQHQGWTPAEISACCEQRWSLGIPIADAARRIRPLYDVEKEEERTRRETWAEKYAIDAETDRPVTRDTFGRLKQCGTRELQEKRRSTRVSV